jgi:hypothetical protein
MTYDAGSLLHYEALIIGSRAMHFFQSGLIESLSQKAGFELIDAIYPPRLLRVATLQTHSSAKNA